MIYEDNYKYSFINEVEFNNKILLSKQDGSKYKKYILIKYIEDGNIKFINAPDKSYIDNFENVERIYEVEEIISTCTDFDSDYDKLIYYHVDNIYFIKYIVDEDFLNIFKLTDNNKNIKELFE